MTSVIITVFEQLRTLEVLLECLEEQECPFRWEVLITDDGSVTQTLDLVRRFARRGILDIRYVWQENCGFRAGTARNNGIRLARGDVLLFLDGDMLVGNDFVARHTLLHETPRLLGCGTRTFTLIGEQDDLADLRRQGKLKLIRTPESDKLHVADQSPTPWLALLSCNFSVRRNPEVHFDEGFVGWGYEDHEFAYRLMHYHDYKVVVSSDLDAIHVSLKTATDDWQPLRKQNGNEQAIVSLLRNVLYFADLHPAADLTPALLLLQTFHLDPVTDRWFRDIKTPAAGTTIAAVREWFGRHNLNLVPVTTATQQ